MNNRADIEIGFNPDLDIFAAVKRLVDVGVPIGSLLASVLDSSFDVAGSAMLRNLATRGELSYRAADTAVLFDLAEFGRLSEFEVLNGFDQVWLRDTHEPPARVPDLRLTSDVGFACIDPLEVANQMALMNAHTVLGDGLGLNYASVECSAIAGLQSDQNLDSLGLPPFN